MPDTRPEQFKHDDDPYYAWLTLNLGANVLNNPVDTLDKIKDTFDNLSTGQQEAILAQQVAYDKGYENGSKGIVIPSLESIKLGQNQYQAYMNGYEDGVNRSDPFEDVN